jgi:hypothetical protein
VRITLLLPCLMGALAAGATPAQSAVPPGSGTVTGSVTANGQKAPLILVYVDESPEDIIVVLASKEVPKDAVPFIGEDVARKFKISAVVFTVSRAGKNLASGLNGVYCPGTEIGYVGMATTSATLQVKRLDATRIEGRIFTPKPVALSSVTYAFDASFAIPLGTAAPAPPPVEVKVSGDTASAPTAVYADYYRTIHSGDVKKMRGFLAAARVKEFDAADEQTRQMMLGILKDNPPEIRIGKPVVAAGKATFTVEGLNLQTTKTTAEVTMVQEGGAWKIDKERWSTTSKRP